MQGNRNKDTVPEIQLRSALHRSGLRFFKNRRPEGVSCRVDILFPTTRLAVFVDGCFWHGCSIHGNQPRTNSAWWHEKLQRNRHRDERNDAELHAEGWQVLRIWEHTAADDAVAMVRAELRR